MTRSLAALSAALDALSGRDFTPHNVDADGLARLDQLTAELEELAEATQVADLLLRFIERLSQSDAIDPRYDLGTPGSAVHLLETIEGYETQLAVSVERYPTPLTLWMVNRILNITKDPTKRAYWLKLLADAQQHPQASTITVQEAQSFLDYQHKKQEE